MMDLLYLLYPMTAFLYMRLALAALARWASGGRLIWLGLAGLLMGGTLDSAIRLFEVVAIAPYWWIRPLVAGALAYVWIRTARQHWRKLAMLATTDPQPPPGAAPGQPVETNS